MLENEIYHTSEGSFAIIEVMSKKGYPHRVKVRFIIDGCYLPRTYDEPGELPNIEVLQTDLMFKQKSRQINAGGLILKQINDFIYNDITQGIRRSA